MRNSRIPLKTLLTCCTSLVAFSCYAQGTVGGGSAGSGYWTELTNSVAASTADASNHSVYNSGPAQNVPVTVTNEPFQHLVYGNTTVGPAWELLFSTLVNTIVFQSVSTAYNYMGAGDIETYFVRCDFDYGTNAFAHYPDGGGPQDDSASRSRWWYYESTTRIVFVDGGGLGGE